MRRCMKCQLGLVFALALTSVACGEAEQPLAAPHDLRPLASAHGSKLLDGRFNEPQANGLTCDPSGAPDDGTGSKLQSAEWIDKHGGHIAIFGKDDAGRVIGHFLVVPRNAVRDNTLFCMRMNGNHTQLRFRAISVDRKGVQTNIGAAGFREPIALYMSFHQARILDTSESGARSTRPLTDDEARSLYIVYDPEDGSSRYERTRSFSVHQYDRYVYAELHHFSKYAMMVD